MPKTKRNNKRKTQTIYKMRGCSKKRKCRGGKSKKYLGGSCGSCGTIKINTNAENPVYPNTGPPSSGFNFLNSQLLRGGGCSMCSLMSGGKKCRACRKKTRKQRGGNNGLPYGQDLAPMKGIPYPNGLVGEAWTSNPSTWGTGNHYQLNTYSPNDVSRQMLDVGAQPPYTYMKGGSWKKNKKGGALFQDVINLSRSFQNGVGSAYNILRGYNPPVDPLPWKDQLKVSQ